MIDSRGRSCVVMLCVVIGVASGCTDAPTRVEEATDVGSVRRLIVSSDPIDPSTPGYAYMSVALAEPNGGFSPQLFPASFSEPTLVYARAKGLISKTYSNNWPAHVRGTASFPLDPNGRVYGSAYQCVGNLQLDYTSATGALTSGAFCTRNNTNLIDSPARSPMDTTFVLNGTGTIKRNNSIDTGPTCGYASYGPCFDFAGIQEIELVPWKKTLSLAASPDSVLVGDSITFTASATGNPTIVVRRWQWRDSLGVVTTVACGTATTCRIAPYTSGTMFVVAKVGINTFVETASAVAIVITNCVTGEELLDNAAVRRRLQQLMFASNPNAPNFWERFEQPLLIYRNAAGDTIFRSPVYVVNGPCSVTSSLPPSQPGDSLLARVHTHPALPGDSAICGDPNAFPPVPVIRRRYEGGASDEDLLNFILPTLHGEPNPWQYIPMIVLDKKYANVYRKREIGYSSNPQTVNWVDGYCRWRGQ